MISSVFYSWQNDLEPKFNRSFIESSLKKAIKNVNKLIDDRPNVELDQATRNTKGATDIAATIFQKIKKASLFVADVSIINKTQNNEIKENYRLTPNPNVLTELGYAAGTLGWENIILINNDAFGNTNELPFDIRGRRTYRYNIDINTSPEEKRNQKTNLISTLDTIIFELQQKIFLLENDPIVKIYIFLNNKIVQNERTWNMVISELYRSCSVKFEKDKDFSKEKLNDICSKINPLKQIRPELEGGKLFRNWCEYLCYKAEEVTNNIFHVLHFYEKIDLEMVGLLTQTETIISTQLTPPCKMGFGNPDLSFFSSTIFKIYNLINEVSKLFREKYSDHEKELWRQYAEK